MIMSHENLLNIFGFSWGALMLTDCIMWALGFITGVTLIWMNIERALKARKERQSGKFTDDQED